LADDSETTPTTDEDTEFHDPVTLTDNATYNGIIEPDSDYDPKNYEPTTSTYSSYNIFSSFSSRK
jgi:hypothetical protein